MATHPFSCVISPHVEIYELIKCLSRAYLLGGIKISEMIEKEEKKHALIKEISVSDTCITATINYFYRPQDVQVHDTIVITSSSAPIESSY
jgi:hypothetical protein